MQFLLIFLKKLSKERKLFLGSIMRARQEKQLILHGMEVFHGIMIKIKNPGLEFHVKVLVLAHGGHVKIINQMNPTV